MKCPSCGAKFKSGTSSCPKCGRYCGRTFANQTEDMFLTENRNPHNGGYTQQQQNIATQYSNTNDPNLQNPNDVMFYSSERISQNRIPQNPTAPDNSPSEIKSSTENPYDSLVGTLEKNTPFIGKESESPGNYADYKIYGKDYSYKPPVTDDDKNQPHTTEFFPDSIVEFKEHVKGRDIAKKINTYLIKLIVISVCLLLIALLEVKLMGASVFIIPIAVVNVSAFAVFLAAIKTSYNKKLTIAVAVYALLFSIVTEMLVNPIIEIAYYTFAVVAIFGFIIRQDVLCLHLIKTVFKYNEVWEDYLLSLKNKE